MSIRLRDFIPKGDIWQHDSAVSKLMEGLSVEFNRFLTTFKTLNTNLLITDIEDTEVGLEFANDRIRECIPNELIEYTLSLTIPQKVTLITYIWQLTTVSTKADLQAILSAYGLTATVLEFSIDPFKANIGKVNFPLYQDSASFIIEVEYLVTEPTTIKLAIQQVMEIYKPASTHIIYKEV